jgi:glyoxylase-like metal-dependent hydrolase (beta-lactamase superfamily II)/rhodanese-related sulfurtransferase
MEQFYLGCLAQASYMIGDEETGIAAVVDPRRDIDVYLEHANRRGLRIEHVFLTHFHADFASGHLELARRCGAVIHIGAGARADYAFEPAREGDTLTWGRTRLKILETPGHTPESISILAIDLTRSEDDPVAVFTGDCLFVGDVGRPDLAASEGVTKEDLASVLFDSTRKLLALPDATILYPGHGAGSMCGKNLSRETSSSIGQQRRFNPALQPMSREAFVAMVTEGQPAAPAYFPYDAAFNRARHETLEEVLPRMLTPLSMEEALQLQREGVIILDTRDPVAFAAGHLPDSISVGLDGKYASWVGAVLPPELPLIVGAARGREEEAVRRLARIGFDHVRGVITGFEEALAARSDLGCHRRLTPDQAVALLRTPNPPLVLDVRQPGEWEESRIDGALNLPLTVLAAEIDRVPSGRALMVHCKGGYRSTVAASLLLRAGFSDLVELHGGIDAWSAAGHDTVGAEVSDHRR